MMRRRFALTQTHNVALISVLVGGDVGCWIVLAQSGAACVCVCVKSHNARLLGVVRVITDEGGGGVTLNGSRVELRGSGAEGVDSRG